MLFKIGMMRSLQDDNSDESVMTVISDDCERYLKMGLRLDPNCTDMNYRNEKDTMLLPSDGNSKY